MPHLIYPGAGVREVGEVIGFEVLGRLGNGVDLGDNLADNTGGTQRGGINKVSQFIDRKSPNKASSVSS